MINNHSLNLLRERVMKKYLLCGLVFLSSGYIYADGHSSVEASKKHENNFAYLSTYTMPAGSNPATLEKSLLRNVQDLKDTCFFHVRALLCPNPTRNGSPFP